MPQEDRSCAKVLDLASGDLLSDRALGVVWLVQEDVYQCVVRAFDKRSTRRHVLSVVSSIYDPLGFVCPFVLTGRLILRDTCEHDLGWHDAVDEDIFKA